MCDFVNIYKIIYFNLGWNLINFLIVRFLIFFFYNILFDEIIFEVFVCLVFKKFLRLVKYNS